MGTVEATTQTMIERLMAEGPITMAEAAEILGPRSGGRLRSAGTVAGYCSRGLHGVTLEGWHGPGGWVTSRPAVIRWLARLHAARVAEDTPSPAVAEILADPFGREAAARGERTVAAFEQTSGRKVKPGGEVPRIRKRRKTK